MSPAPGGGWRCPGTRTARGCRRAGCGRAGSRRRWPPSAASGSRTSALSSDHRHADGPDDLQERQRTTNVDVPPDDDAEQRQLEHDEPQAAREEEPRRRRRRVAPRSRRRPTPRPASSTNVGAQRCVTQRVSVEQDRRRGRVERIAERSRRRGRSRACDPGPSGSSRSRGRSRWHRGEARGAVLSRGAGHDGLHYSGSAA